MERRDECLSGNRKGTNAPVLAITRSNSISSDEGQRTRRKYGGEDNLYPQEQYDVGDDDVQL